MTADTPAAVYVDPHTLTPWDRNPRTNDHAVADVAASIARFGFAAPIVARKADRRIVAGHTRHKAALSLGLDSVPVRFVDLTESEASALAIADNKLGELADWSDDLGRLLADLDEGGVDLEGLGFDDDELEGLLAEGEAVATDDDSDDTAPAAPVGQVDSRPGEVYALGPHRVICGDCRDAEIVARLFGDERAAVAVTSPPYASRRTYDEGSGFRPIPPDEYVDWFEAVQRNVRGYLADDGSWFVNIKPHTEEGQRHLYVTDLLLAHCRRWGWRFVDELCWLRTGFPGRFRRRFKNSWEPVYHFTIQQDIKFRPDNVRHESSAAMHYTPGHDLKMSHPTGRAQQGTATRLFDGTALPDNVLRFGRANPIDGSQEDSRTEHTAPYPVKLPAFFVRAFSDPGDVIFDPFLGSGTTLIAAARHGRRGFGCEISPKYCDVIRRRWTAYARANDLDPGPGALDDEGGA